MSGSERERSERERVGAERARASGSGASESERERSERERSSSGRTTARRTTATAGAPPLGAPLARGAHRLRATTSTRAHHRVNGLTGPVLQKVVLGVTLRLRQSICSGRWHVQQKVVPGLTVHP